MQRRTPTGGSRSARRSGPGSSPMGLCCQWSLTISTYGAGCSRCGQGLRTQTCRSSHCPRMRDARCRRAALRSRPGQQAAPLEPWHSSRHSKGMPSLLHIWEPAPDRRLNEGACRNNERTRSSIVPVILLCSLSLSCRFTPLPHGHDECVQWGVKDSSRSMLPGAAGAEVPQSICSDKRNSGSKNKGHMDRSCSVASPWHCVRRSPCK